MWVKHIFVAVTAAGLVLSPLVAHAQRGTNQLRGVAQQANQPATVELAGTLESIRIGPCEQTKGRAEVGVDLIVVAESGDNAGERLNIHLGPAAATRQWIESLQIGEKLVIQAFATSAHAPGHYVAQRLDVGGVIIDLRDAALQPSWARGNRGRGQGNLGRGGGRRAAAGGPGAASGMSCGRGNCRQWEDGNTNSAVGGQQARATAGPGRGRGQAALTGPGRGQGRGQAAVTGPGCGQCRGGGQGQVGRQGQGAGRAEGRAPAAD